MPETKEATWRRLMGGCQYCRRKMMTENWSVDLARGRSSVASARVVLVEWWEGRQERKKKEIIAP